MLNLEIETKLSQQEATKRIKSYFGKDGLGLKLDEESTDCLNFSGGGGFVNAIVCPSEEKTRIELLSQEWEYHLKTFAKKMS